MNRAVIATIALTALLVVGGVFICRAASQPAPARPAMPGPEEAPRSMDPAVLDRTIARTHPR